MIYKSLGFSPPVYRRARQYLPVPPVGAVKPGVGVACGGGGAVNCARDGGDCGRAGGGDTGNCARDGGVIVCLKGATING